MPGEFIDTNIVTYSFSQDDKKQDKALELLANKPVISTQVLNETANIIRRKLGFDVSVTPVVINRISQECASLQPITLSTIDRALDIVERYGYSHYDSLVIASALQAECTTLYSEDIPHGQAIDNRLISSIRFYNSAINCQERVGVPGLRPSPLPHHRTIRFSASSC